MGAHMHYASEIIAPIEIFQPTKYFETLLLSALKWLVRDSQF